MSEESSLKSNKYQSQTLDNIHSSNNHFNNIINNINLNLSERSISKESSLINKIKQNKSSSNNNSNGNITENLQNAKNIFPNNPDNFDDIGQYQISIILLLFKETFKDHTINESFIKNECSKINDIILNNNEYNLFDLMVNIFRNALEKIIKEKTKVLIDQINQYQSTLKLIEQNNRYQIQQIYLKQTKIDILENEIESYEEMEEEFDEMKEKLKYEKGKFLHNEKKENEILILRAENSNLKKIIDKNEKTIEEKDLFIESLKKKSVSMLNTNNNTIRNSFDFNDVEHPIPSSLIYINHNMKHKNIQNFKSLSNFHKTKSPINKNKIYHKEKSLKTNNNIQYSSFSKKINYYDKKSNSGYRNNTKEIINKKLNKDFKFSKIRRKNDNLLDNYNKSSARISNSILSHNSNNGSSKRIKKNITFFIKNNKNHIISGLTKMQKKLRAGLSGKNINNLSKYNSNKIIVNSILDNSNNIPNTKYMFNTTRKNFPISKKSSKTNIKNITEDYIGLRNNRLLIKTPTTFINHNIDNNVKLKNNIIINNIIQNGNSIPIAAVTSRPTERNGGENEQYYVLKKNSNKNKMIKIYNPKEKNYKKISTGIIFSNSKKKSK